jgi:hypothetical protein
LQSNYQKNITSSIKNHNQLTSIYKENTEKYQTIKKRLEKLERLYDENKLKNNFDDIRNSERKYAEKTIEINSIEKNFLGSLMKNIINQNEEEVKKNQKIKNTLLICLANSFKNLDLNSKEFEIKVNHKSTKEGIEYLKEKYKNFFDNENSNSVKNAINDIDKKLNKIVGKKIIQ